MKKCEKCNEKLIEDVDIYGQGIDYRNMSNVRSNLLISYKCGKKEIKKKFGKTKIEDDYCFLNIKADFCPKCGKVEFYINSNEVKNKVD